MFGEAIDVVRLRVNRADRHIANQHVFGHAPRGGCQSSSKRSHVAGLAETGARNRPIIRAFNPSIVAHQKSASPYNQNLRYNGTSQDAAPARHMRSTESAEGKKKTADSEAV